MSSSLSLVLRITVLLAGVFTTASYTAQAAADPAPTTITKAAYPLETCVVSGGKLGGMGKPVDHVHRQAGQPDRTVRFCCRGCIRKFEKEPAKFLAKLDAAETAAASATKKSSAP